MNLPSTEPVSRHCGTCMKHRKEKRAAAAASRRKADIQTPRGRAAKLARDARHRATKKGLPFEITIEDIAAAIEAGVCEVTGIPFALESHPFYSVHPHSPSLDRHDHRLGYTKANTRVTVSIYNMAKGVYHLNDLYLLALSLVNSTPRRT